MGRRSFLRVSVAAGLTLTVGASVAGFLGFFNKLKITTFGGVVTVAASRVPRPGADPVRISEGKFWLLNLQGAEGDILQAGGTGGVLALYTKCPHLGCSVPWNPAFDGSQVGFPGVTGWFRCPCHASTYSRAGIRVAGPAPRPMDDGADVERRRLGERRYRQNHQRGRGQPDASRRLPGLIHTSAACGNELVRPASLDTAASPADIVTGMPKNACGLLLT